MADVVGKIIPKTSIDQLRSAGYAIVPLTPSEEMVNAGAPFCFQPGEAQNEQTWNNALYDARDCYQAMIERGGL